MYNYNPKRIRKVSVRVIFSISYTRSAIIQLYEYLITIFYHKFLLLLSSRNLLESCVFI